MTLVELAFLLLDRTAVMYPSVVEKFSITARRLCYTYFILLVCYLTLKNLIYHQNKARPKSLNILDVKLSQTV